VLQPGAEIAAIAMPEKKKDTSGAARTDIWYPMAFWVVGPEGTGDGNGAEKY